MITEYNRPDSVASALALLARRSSPDPYSGRRDKFDIAKIGRLRRG